MYIYLFILQISSIVKDKRIQKATKIEDNQEVCVFIVQMGCRYFSLLL